MALYVLKPFSIHSKKWGANDTFHPTLLENLEKNYPPKKNDSKSHFPSYMLYKIRIKHIYDFIDRLDFL